MVAGGYGATPLMLAAKSSKELGKQVVVLEGAISGAERLYVSEFLDLGGISGLRLKMALKVIKG
ncbi:hypothetical protein C5S36_14990 [Candidatus Methanophagaceae archaeon]|jgi:ferredoxin-NADP reductase|nr:hypothetical protein C5S36_14990 [Methanophagales archaeon]OEU53061.1 MAG: hypothetical protein BA871_17275 [Desulfuromonadales bacterium C00003096]